MAKGKKWQKNTADFCENRKNHGKNAVKSRHQITGPNTIIQSIKFNIQHCRPSLHAVQGQARTQKFLRGGFGRGAVWGGVGGGEGVSPILVLDG